MSKYVEKYVNEIYENVYLEKNEEIAMKNASLILNNYKKNISVKELFKLIFDKLSDN